MCLGRENQRKERVGEGGIERRKDANLAACAESLKTTPNLFLGVGNQHLCCMCGYDGFGQQFYLSLWKYHRRLHPTVENILSR